MKNIIKLLTLISILFLVILSCSKEPPIIEKPDDIPKKPSVSIGVIDSIGCESAIINGNVTDNGNLTITKRGVVYSMSSVSTTPTVDHSMKTTVEGSGKYTIELTNLKPNTDYTVRAFAANEKGYGYSESKPFTTKKDCNNTISITTIIPSDITQNSAKTGGNIIDDGGSTITARGVCWSKSPNPTLNNSITEDGSGMGEFNSFITGLICDTTYYVKAYAINSVDTLYGQQEVFTTLACSNSGIPIDELEDKVWRAIF